MSDLGYATSRKDGLMWAECWCQATTVLVTPADVRNGRTGTCDGDEWCRERPRLRQAKLDVGGRTGVARRDSLGLNVKLPRDVGSSGADGQSLTDRNRRHAR